MILYENRLLAERIADDSHELACLMLFFLKKLNYLLLSSAAHYRWRFKGYHYVSP